jgi:hypothetical protein
VDRLWSWRRTVGIAVALALLALAVREADVAGDWPRAGFRLPPYDGVAALADQPEPGGVLALPAARQGHQHEQRVVFQLLHQRPITGHIYLPYLAADQTPAIVDASPFLTWASEQQPASDAAPGFTEADRAMLRDQGIAFVTVFWREVDPTRQNTLHENLLAALGTPVAHQPNVWTAYAIRAD